MDQSFQVCDCASQNATFKQIIIPVISYLYMSHNNIIITEYLRVHVSIYNVFLQLLKVNPLLHQIPEKQALQVFMHKIISVAY